MGVLICAAGAASQNNPTRRRKVRRLEMVQYRQALIDDGQFGLVVHFHAEVLPEELGPGFRRKSGVRQRAVSHRVGPILGIPRSCLERSRVSALSVARRHALPQDGLVVHAHDDAFDICAVRQ